MALLSQALAAEFNAVGAVDEAIEDGVRERRIADHVVPMIDGHLAGDDGGSLLIAIFDDLEEIAALLVVERIPPRKAVCPDMLIGVKSMAYVMRYNHFPH